MAIRGSLPKWCDLLILVVALLALLATLAVLIRFVVVNWKYYVLCEYPWHIWKLVLYTTVFATFAFGLLKVVVDSGSAAGRSQQASLSVLSLLLYSFLWGWTVIGTVWVIKEKICKGEIWALRIWLITCYTGLVLASINCFLKWLTRREHLMLRSQQGIYTSWFGVLVDMICVPDREIQARRQVASHIEAQEG